MKKILIFTIVCCVSFAGFAQEKQVVPATSEVKAVASQETKAEETLVLKEDTYDFGKIPQGKPVTHVFEVSNSGKTPLTIANVQASCGCTTPEWEKDQPIAPGASTKIKVGYNAAAEGPFTKLVTVTYGDNLNKQITIKGEVWKTPTSSAPVNPTIDELKN